MASATFFSTATLPRAERASAVPSRAAHRGLFQRVIDAIIESNQRRAEREIARFIASNGGRLTDDLERQVERTYLV